MPITRESYKVDKKLEDSKIVKSSKSSLQKGIYFEAVKPKYSIDDIILSEPIRSQLLDLMSFKRHSKMVFEEWGLNEVIKNNYLAVNLYGPPGTGKTMAAHVIANELNRDLLCVNYADIESKYVGETAKNLSNLFKYSKENNLILFFDEADALLSKRVNNMNNATDVSVNQTRSVLLMLMNDYDDVIIFTTNFINNFDEAFMRRIQYHIKFELPNREVREVLWKKYIPNKMPNNLNIELISEKYSGVSGSDICNAVRIAAFKSAREGDNLVKHENFDYAIRQILLSKQDNQKVTIKESIKERYVTEEYVKAQLSTREESKI